MQRLFEESRHLADETPLPVDLVSDDERLSAPPWELLRDPETDCFLALAKCSQFSRVLAETPTGDTKPATLRPGNLRVCVRASALGEAAILGQRESTTRITRSSS